MATQIVNILSFVDVAAGASAPLAHGLNYNGLARVPDELLPSGVAAGDFTLAADDTNVTVTNNGAVTASILVLVRDWHSILRAFGAEGVLALSPQPFIASFGVPFVNLFGDGSDGDVTLVGDIALARDVFYETLDTDGFDIDCAGFRIFATVAVNVNGDSIIHRDGNAAVADAAGAALAAAVLGDSGAGGAGATGNGAAGGAIAQCLGGVGGEAGTGAGGVSTAGAGGAVTAPTANESLPRALTSSFSGRTIDGTIYKGGTGGGGGGGDGAADEGGGGGGGGGVVMISAPAINVAVAATIRAGGGAGDDGTAANCGGGGGGGGGSVVLNSHNITVLGTLEAPGGALGVSGGGNGTDGNAGAAGVVYQNQI